MIKAQYPAATARTISRILRKAGFLMADTSDRYRWTEGFHVHRLGYSKTVSLSYHWPNKLLRPSTTEQRLENRKKMDMARELLASKGYLLDERGYIECQFED